MWRAGVVLAFVMTGAIASMGAQHGYSPAEIAEGGRLFQASCARCHGADGDAVAGVNFARGQFRRATTDDEIARIITVGIPGTGMPPGNFSEFDAGRIVAYLRSMTAAPAASPGGPCDTARDKALVEGKGKCLTCHRVDGVGSQLGPDLNSVGPLRRTGELQRSLLDPDAEIVDDNRFARVVTARRRDDHRPAAQPGQLLDPVVRREERCCRHEVRSCGSTRFSRALRCRRIGRH
jgi:mono/diheme cytochrome c family protein